MSGADAFAAVADRLDLFTDRVRYERVLACRDVADWCRAQDGAGMTATDAFEAVIDYCDIAAHAMPVLGNYVGFERYVAYGGIAGWCRKRGRDAWVHQTKGVEMADKTKDPYGFAKEKVDEAYVALYEALEALESVGADFCTDHGYNGDTMDGYGLLDVVRDIEDSLEGM